MSYTVRKADIVRDKQDVLSLWRRNFGKGDPKRYEWIYENNPAGPPTCFLLLQQETGAVVGCVSMFPRNLFLQGNCTPAYICGDFVVDKDHRTLGPAMRLIKSAVAGTAKNGPSLIMGFPNDTATPVMFRAGFEELSGIMTMIRVMNVGSLVRRYINFRKVENALSAPINALIRVQISALGRKNRIQEYHIEESDHFDARFDDLWMRMKDTFEFIGERSSRYLNWRFKNSPNAQYEVLTLARNGGRDIDGYIVYSRLNERVLIDDFGFASNMTLCKLMTGFLKCRRKSSSEVVGINLSGSSGVIEQLKSTGFVFRPSNRRTVVYANAPYKALIDKTKQSGWLITGGDNDV